MTATYEQTRANQLRKMRIIATSLLGFMALLYVVSRVFEQRHPWMRFLTAFAEAGIVGALADWFAVVALFKHPMGIPIWHTAIIPSKKSEISRTLAHFVVDNFLTQEVVGKKLASYDLSANAGALLLENSTEISEKIVEAIPSLFRMLNDRDIQKLLHEQVSDRLANIKLAPLAGDLLDMLSSHDKLDALFEEVIRAVQNIARQNKDFITRKVKEEIPLIEWGFFNDIKEEIAKWLSDKIAAKIDETTKDLKGDSTHELRISFEKEVKRLIRDLKHSKEFEAQGNKILHAIMENPVIKDYIMALWIDIKNLVLADANKPDSSIKKHLSTLLAGFASNVLKEQPFKDRINAWISSKLLVWIDAYKNEVSHTIIKTVESWKNEEIVKKLELSVGRDLQYIRLNGTIVGGLAGLILYSLYQVILVFCST